MSGFISVQIEDFLLLLTSREYEVKDEHSVKADEIADRYLRDLQVMNLFEYAKSKNWIDEVDTVNSD